jgi:hypothetical protein
VRAEVAVDPNRSTSPVRRRDGALGQRLAQLLGLLVALIAALSALPLDAATLDGACCPELTDGGDDGHEAGQAHVAVGAAARESGAEPTESPADGGAVPVPLIPAARGSLAWPAVEGAFDDASCGVNRADVTSHVPPPDAPSAAHRQRGPPVG